MSTDGPLPGESEAAFERRMRKKSTVMQPAGVSDTVLSPEEAAARAGITLDTGGGVPGQSGRQAREQLLGLRRQYQDYMLGSQNQLRSLQAQQDEAREAAGSAAASRSVGGAAPARALEKFMYQYREPQARIMGQQALAEANLGRDVASVRNLLAQRRYEEALKRAAGVAQYWQKVIGNYAQPGEDLNAMLQQLGVKG